MKKEHIPYRGAYFKILLSSDMIGIKNDIHAAVCAYEEETLKAVSGSTTDDLSRLDELKNELHRLRSHYELELKRRMEEAEIPFEVHAERFKL